MNIWSCRHKYMFYYDIVRSSFGEGSYLTDSGASLEECGVVSRQLLAVCYHRRTIVEQPIPLSKILDVISVVISNMLKWTVVASTSMDSTMS